MSIELHPRSFGDYFKREVVAWAWDYFVNVIGIERDRVYVTYFGGDEESGLEPDLECKQLWIDQGRVPRYYSYPAGGAGVGIKGGTDGHR